MGLPRNVCPQHPELCRAGNAPHAPTSSHQTQPILTTSTFQESWPTLHTHLKQEKAASHRRCCQLSNLLEDESSTPANQPGSSENRTPLTTLRTHPTDNSAFGANCSVLRDSLTNSTSREKGKEFVPSQVGRFTTSYSSLWHFRLSTVVTLFSSTTVLSQKQTANT